MFSVAILGMTLVAEACGVLTLEGKDLSDIVYAIDLIGIITSIFSLILIVKIAIFKRSKNKIAKEGKNDLSKVP